MNPRIVVVSLGPGDPELMNYKTVRILKSADSIILRTGVHPVASWLKEQNLSFSTLDFLYEASEDFDQLSDETANFLWKKAGSSPIVYGIPDPFSDDTVRALFFSRPADGMLEIVPGVGYTDTFLSLSGVLLPAADLRSVSSCSLAESKSFNPNISLLVTEIDQPLLAGQIKVFLSDYLEDDHPILFLHSGTSPLSIPLYELDRQPRYDHLTSVLIPASAFRSRQRFVISDLVEIMDTLRAPDGCPWDSRQTHQSLRQYMAEEAWEAIAAIDEQDPDHLAEELGDLLFQIVFHSSIGKSFDEFTIQDVISSICRKMIRRHPHVFDNTVCSPSELSGKWEEIKRSETGRQSVSESLSDVSSALPALIYAGKVIKKCRQLPFPQRTAKDLVSEICRTAASLDSGDSDSEKDVIGRLLYLLAELSYQNHLDAELLLHHEVDRVIRSVQTGNFDPSGIQRDPEH